MLMTWTEKVPSVSFFSVRPFAEICTQTCNTGKGCKCDLVRIKYLRGEHVLVLSICVFCVLKKGKRSQPIGGNVRDPWKAVEAPYPQIQGRRPIRFLWWYVFQTKPGCNPYKSCEIIILPFVGGAGEGSDVMLYTLHIHTCSMIYNIVTTHTIENRHINSRRKYEMFCV